MAIHARSRGEVRLRIVVVAAVVAATTAACALLTDLDGLTSGSPSPPFDGSLDEGVLEGGEAATFDGAGPLDGGSACLGSAGPRGVRVGRYCVDETEVTASQYALFLASKSNDTSGQPPECASNASYEPAYTTTGETPVRGVDWCDALAYCKWAGKRLCGRIGTGAEVPANLRENAEADEWFQACSRGGSRTYPYGSTFDPTACNLPALDAGGAQRPVRSFPKCVGGYEGLFDMTGNLWEWENSCETTNGERRCAQRGASYAAATSGPCSQSYVVSATSQNDVTIRCCSD